MAALTDKTACLAALDDALAVYGKELKNRLDYGMSRDQAMDYYNALKQCRAVVELFYRQLDQALPYAKQEITQDLRESNPVVGKFIDQFKLKTE